MGSVTEPASTSADGYRVLLIAYECSPYRGSERAVGWGRLLQAARCAEVHTLTSEANYRDLLRARAEGLIPANVFIYTPEPDKKLARLQKKPGMFDYNYAAYRHWHRLALRLARQLHARLGFTLAHQTSVCTFREPGDSWKLDIPFVWGPTGGTQNFPVRMLPLLSCKDACKESARLVANMLVLHTNRRVRAAAKKSTVVFAANRNNEHDLRSVLKCSVERLLETGLTGVQEPDRTRYLHRVEEWRQGREAPVLKLLWSGQLHARKALPVLLHALERLPKHILFELEVLGSGPMQDAWMQQAQALGLGRRVHFLGQLSFKDAVARMREADVFCFTSLRDTSGNVVLEALAAGVPVLCFHHQGAADMVDDRSGIRLPVTTPGRAAAAWADAIAQLAAEPARLLELSYGATEQARTFLWDANGDRVNRVYSQIANHAHDRQPARSKPSRGYPARTPFQQPLPAKQ